jgi:hypothetical protein
MWPWFTFALITDGLVVAHLIKAREPTLQAQTLAPLPRTPEPAPDGPAMRCVWTVVQRLPGKSVTVDTKAVVAFGWAVPLILLALVPLDVALVRRLPASCAQCAVLGMTRGLRPRRLTECTPARPQTIANSDRKTLLVLYEIPYYATQVLTWLLLPFFQLYSDAGDFTVRERLKTSAKENAMFYAVVAGLGIVGVFILVVTRGISFANIVSGAIAISVSFSVASGILLLGYGLAEVPRSYWFNSSLQRRQQWCVRTAGLRPGSQA